MSRAIKKKSLPNYCANMSHFWIIALYWQLYVQVCLLFLFICLVWSGLSPLSRSLKINHTADRQIANNIKLFWHVINIKVYVCTDIHIYSGWCIEGESIGKIWVIQQSSLEEMLIIWVQIKYRKGASGFKIL